MKKLSLQKATGSLAEYARALNGQPLVVTAGGKPIAALVPVDGVDLETLAVGTNPEFLDLIERSRRRQRAPEGRTLDEVRRRLEIPLPAAYKAPPRGGKAKAGGRRARGAANGRNV